MAVAFAWASVYFNGTITNSNNVEAVNHIATGQYQVTFKSDTFDDTPNIQATAMTGIPGQAEINAVATVDASGSAITMCTVRTRRAMTGADVDVPFWILAVGTAR